MKTHKLPSEVVDAMEARTQLGALLDRVELTRQRFVIQRRGKPKALLVPLTDERYIHAGVTAGDEGLQAVYGAFERVKGVFDDPTMTDASRTVDAWVYSDQTDDRQQEGDV